MFRVARAARFFKGNRWRRFGSTSQPSRSSSSSSHAFTKVAAVSAVVAAGAITYLLWDSPIGHAELEAGYGVAERAAIAVFKSDEPAQPIEKSFRWIDVTYDNFEQVLPQFKSLLEKSAFVSIDTEFSGLTVAPDQVPGYKDSVTEYYRKKASAITQFSVLQIGICLWVPDASSESLIAYPFNFYVFPRPYTHNRASIPANANTSFMEPSHNPVFAVQTSSLQFLAQHGFDFNKLISKGITFMDGEKEKYFREAVGFEKAPEGFKEKKSVKIHDKDKQFVEDLINQVRQWHKACSKPEQCEPLRIPKLNGFHRLVAYQELPKQFGADTLKISTIKDAPRDDGKQSSSGTLEIALLTEAEKKENRLKITRKNEEMFEKALGMRRLMKLIFDDKAPKTIVGHNMFLDLLYLYNGFHKKLPYDPAEFRRELHALMPRIVDTKHVSTTNKQLQQMLPESTALNTVYQLAKDPRKFPSPTIRFDRSFGTPVSHDGTGFLHQAAYDAYITGYSFAKFMYFIRSEKAHGASEIIETSEAPYLNKLHLMFNRNRFMDVDGSESTKKPRARV